MKHETLDVRGQLCPIPVIRTQNKIKMLEQGDTLTVLCTDPGALSDIPAWARVHGHTLVETQESGQEIIITIRVQGDPS